MDRYCFVADNGMKANRGARLDPGRIETPSGADPASGWQSLPDAALAHAAELMRLQQHMDTSGLLPVGGLPALQRIAARLQADLHAGLPRGEFSYDFQPMFRASTGEVFAYEAFLRWTHLGAVVPPARFLPFIEDAWLAGQVQQSLLGSVAEVLAIPGYEGSVSLNWSALQLADHSQVSAFAARVLGLGLEPARIIVEVTGHATSLRTNDTHEGLLLLKDYGFNVAVDGFGRSNLGLAELCTLPIDIIKVDRALVRALSDSPRARMVLGAIVDVARKLGRLVVADGVESLDQLIGAAGVGCEVVQGDFVGAAAAQPQGVRAGDAALFGAHLAQACGGRP
jgi:EAL domain-containing protein (putative c-di-GMP-specific phosphodiesterase class I)